MSVLDCYPITRPVRTTEPTFVQEPITLDEAKKQCGLEGNPAHDEDLKGWIVGARQQVEHDTGIVCYTGAFTWKQTQFPCGEVLELPDIRPVTAATVAYLDSNGTSQTWSASEYALHTSGVTQWIGLAYGETWPTVRGDQNGITVTLTVGYATVLLIPQRIKSAVKLAVYISWLLKMENAAEAERQQVAYERLIAGLRRGSYP